MKNKKNWMIATSMVSLTMPFYAISCVTEAQKQAQNELDALILLAEQKLNIFNKSQSKQILKEAIEIAKESKKSNLVEKLKNAKKQLELKISEAQKIENENLEVPNPKKTREEIAKEEFFNKKVNNQKKLITKKQEFEAEIEKNVNDKKNLTDPEQIAQKQKLIDELNLKKQAIEEKLNKTTREIEAIKNKQSFNDDEEKLERKIVSYINKDPNYKLGTTNEVKIDLFFTKKGADVPYVELSEMIKKLDGYFTSNDIEIKKSENGDLILKNQLGVLKIDHLYNQIKVSNLKFFDSIINLENFKEDFGQGLRMGKFKETPKDSKHDGSVLFNLENHNLDIKNFEGKILIPFSLFNLLFGSTNYHNSYFIGDKIIGIDFLVSPLGESSHLRNDIRSGTTIETTQTLELREHNYNFITFTMDYFYGLKEHKNIDKFENYFTNNNLKENLLSNDSKKYNKAYSDFFTYGLEDLHTSLWDKSVFDKKGAFWNRIETTGLRGKNQEKVTEELTNYKYDENSSFIKADEKFVRINGDMAVIVLDEFQNGDKDNLNSDNDSYTLMKEAMVEIKKHSEVKNIILDISLNSGGDTSAFFKVLGFISDDILHEYEYNTLTESWTDNSWEVDTDGDGRFENDAYTQYKWYVLSSVSTFSAANEAVGAFKAFNLGKVLGKKSGGGACTVIPIVLPDGTGLTISSPNGLTFPDGKGGFISTEDGFEPDIEVEHKDFYNDDVLKNYLK